MERRSGISPSPEALIQRRIHVVAGRIEPVMVIVDLNLDPLSWSPNSGATDLIAHAGDDGLRSAVQLCYREGRQIVHVVEEDILLRIVPMEARSPCVAVMIESFGHRGSLSQAARAYGLTKRETEILGSVVRGMSNAEIADMLYIAQSTVADHIKSIMRKTKTTKRVQLLSKLAYGEPGAESA